MENIFTQIAPDTYSVDHDAVTIIVKVKSNTIIELEIPENQYNPGGISSLWYFKTKNDEHPTRCIPVNNIIYDYYL